MKNKIIKIGRWFLPVFALFLFTISCDDDDDSSSGGNFDLATLQASIDQAESLIETSMEGINPGDFQPGSKDDLQDVLNWIYGRMETSDNQEDINDAVLKLDAAIETFMESVVVEAFAWVQQTKGSHIELSTNIKPILNNNPFTIEIEIYAVDLNQLGYSNNVFSMDEEPTRGFGVRYFGDTSIQTWVGTGSGWPETDRGSAEVMVGNEWVNIAMTNTGSEQKLFLNGQLIASQTATPATAPEVPFVIGNSPYPDWADRVCNALFRELRIWNVALDDATIQNNINASFEGTEANLEAYFPMSSNLGTTFEDVTGNYTATFVGDVEWVTELPVIVLDYTNLDAAIQEMTDFKGTIVEGKQDGDYPVGTVAFIDELLAEANKIRAEGTRQNDLDDTANSLGSRIDQINSLLVADADGVYVDSDDSSVVGLRITPNYTPQGDYTVEFDLNIKTFLMTSNSEFSGEIFGNGTYGLRLYGYSELTEENLLNSGGLWNFTNIEGAWVGPRADPLTIKSGEWQHIAIVHDDTAKTTAIYVDNVMVGEATDIGVPDVSGWGEIWLGNSWGSKMNGSIKDFRIWDTVRTPAQFDAEITGSEDYLQVYFPLDRIGGIKFSDETGDYQGEMRGIIWND